jgi:hypothetical protein
MNLLAPGVMVLALHCGRCRLGDKYEAVDDAWQEGADESELTFFLRHSHLHMFAISHV